MVPITSTMPMAATARPYYYYWRYGYRHSLISSFLRNGANGLARPEDLFQDRAAVVIIQNPARLHPDSRIFRAAHSYGKPNDLVKRKSDSRQILRPGLLRYHEPGHASNIGGNIK